MDGVQSTNYGTTGYRCVDFWDRVRAAQEAADAAKLESATPSLKAVQPEEAPQTPSRYSAEYFDVIRRAQETRFANEPLTLPFGISNS